MHPRAAVPDAGTLAAVAVAFLALALPAAGSAARANATPGAWAEQVCAAVADWSAAAEAKADALDKLPDPKSFLQVRAVFSRFLDEIVRETDRMIVRVDIAGTPAVSRGPAIRQRLRALLVRSRGLLADARRQAAGLLLSDPAGFGKGLTAIGSTIEKQFATLGAAFDHLDSTLPSPELDRAITRAPSCRRL